MSAVEERIKSEAGLTKNVRLDQLWCGDCKYKYPMIKPSDISRCKQYKDKPNQVLCGGECKLYKKQLV